MIIEEQQDKIEDIVKKKIKSVAPLSSTLVARVYRVTMADNSIYVIKSSDGVMDIEAWSLNYLQENTNLPVPKIYYHDNNLAIMEFVSSGYGADETCQKDAAELLAEMHKIKGDKYGFEHDTFMGPFLQKNALCDSWIEFFVEHRLLYMAKKTLDAGRIDESFMNKLDKLINKIDKYLEEPESPSLIHGNVWGGNILSKRNKMTAFLGPSLCFADFELELAFIRLWRTFSDNFFYHYNQITPIKAGFFEERVDIYSLYYLLMYSHKFGKSYVLRAKRILDKLT